MPRRIWLKDFEEVIAIHGKKALLCLFLSSYDVGVGWNEKTKSYDFYIEFKDWFRIPSDWNLPPDKVERLKRVAQEIERRSECI